MYERSGPGAGEFIFIVPKVVDEVQGSFANI